LTTALYPGSFDPPTNGHVDIVTRAAAVFDKVVVGVYDTPAKTLLFNTSERVALMREAIKDLPNVKVMSFSGLTVDFAREVGAKVLVRGLRALSDFEMELQMASMNRNLDPNIEVVCLMTSPQYTFLSASLTKEIRKLGGDVRNLVPTHIADALDRKFDGRDNSDTIPRFLET